MSKITKPLDLWTHKTDPAFTKTNSVGGGRQETSIPAIYMDELFTQAYGQATEGWGYRVIKERFDQTKPAVLVAGNKVSGIDPVYFKVDGVTQWELNHTVEIEFWTSNKENFIVQAGHTKYKYMTKYGDMFIDYEYDKKSITDAVKKCMSILGVCADIYTGQFEDKDYVASAKLENEINKSSDKEERIDKELYDLNISVDQSVTAIDQVARNPHTGRAVVNAVYKGIFNKIDNTCRILNQSPHDLVAKLNDSVARFDQDISLLIAETK